MTQTENAVTGQDDMVLVPRKPTPAMIEAAWAEALGENAEGVWREMIAACECPRESETHRAGEDVPPSS